MSEPITEPWLTIHRSVKPLVVSFPHTGLDIPEDCTRGLVSLDLARHDADWFIDWLYGFAGELGATTVHTALSRTVIDVNRDPSGASLYPGQATTGLVPIETFDGRALYRDGMAPDAGDVERRKRVYFAAYHAALAAELARLRKRYPRVVLYDCHSIRSVLPRLFPGELAGLQHRNELRKELRSQTRNQSGEALRRKPMVVGGQRPLHRRVDHAPLRPARGRHPRRTDGACLPRLSAGGGGTAALGCGFCAADTERAAWRARSLSRIC
jgi:N-formylglutamate amidohydrolase